VDTWVLSRLATRFGRESGGVGREVAVFRERAEEFALKRAWKGVEEAGMAVLTREEEPIT
jgi:hypothetical protein